MIDLYETALLKGRDSENNGRDCIKKHSKKI